MEILIAGMITGFLLALPTGPGAFAVIRTTLASGFKAGLMVAFAPIIADALWMSLALFEPHIINAIKDTNGLVEKIVGGILIVIAYNIFRSAADNKKTTFWVALRMVVFNATIAITGGFILSLTAGPHYTFLPVRGKILLLFVILVSDTAAWMLIIKASQKLSKSFSTSWLAIAYSSIVAIAGITLIIKTLT